jgi:hypothetical protein
MEVRIDYQQSVINYISFIAHKFAAHKSLDPISILKLLSFIELAMNDKTISEETLEKMYKMSIS